MRIMWLFSRIVAELSGTDKPGAEKSVFGKKRSGRAGRLPIGTKC